MELNKEIVISKMNETDGGMLFDLKTGSYYRINDVACFIVECIKSGNANNIETIASLLCEEYEVDTATASEDVASVVEDLIQLGIIIE